MPEQTGFLFGLGIGNIGKKTEDWNKFGYEAEFRLPGGRFYQHFDTEGVKKDVDEEKFKRSIDILVEGLEHYPEPWPATELCVLLESVLKGFEIPPKLVEYVVIAIGRKLDYLENTLRSEVEGRGGYTQLHTLRTLGLVHQVSSQLCEHKLFAPRLRKIRERSKQLLQFVPTTAARAFVSAKADANTLATVLETYFKLQPESKTATLSAISQAFLTNPNRAQYFRDEHYGSHFDFFQSIFTEKKSEPQSESSGLEVSDELVAFSKELLSQLAQTDVGAVLDISGPPSWYVRNAEFFATYVPNTEQIIFDKVVQDFSTRDAASMNTLLEYWLSKGLPHYGEHNFIEPKRGKRAYFAMLESKSLEEQLTFMSLQVAAGRNEAIKPLLTEYLTDHARDFCNGTLPDQPNRYLDLFNLFLRMNRGTPDEGKLEELYLRGGCEILSALPTEQINRLLTQLLDAFEPVMQQQLLRLTLRIIVPNKIRDRELSSEFFQLLEMFHQRMKTSLPNDVVTAAISEALAQASPDYAMRFLEQWNQREIDQKNAI